MSKLGVSNDILEFLFKWVDADEDYPKIPEAKGQISAIRSEAFFIPLYELYLTYGGIFRLTFGPKVCLYVIAHFMLAKGQICFITKRVVLAGFLINHFFILLAVFSDRF